jgi:hypothetical protein
MNKDQRLSDVKKHLATLDKKLALFENELICTSNPGQLFDVQQRIDNNILPSIRKFEAEYWEILFEYHDLSLVKRESLEDALNVTLKKLQENIDLRTMNYSGEVCQILHQILEVLIKTDQPSSKLKLTAPLIPGVLALEMETNALKSLKKVFQPIERFLLGGNEKK